MAISFFIHKEVTCGKNYINRKNGFPVEHFYGTDRGRRTEHNDLRK
jgi:hypothetical protein